MMQGTVTAPSNIPVICASQVGANCVLDESGQEPNDTMEMENEWYIGIILMGGIPSLRTVSQSLIVELL
ncbi:hypothetical protein J1N35_040008 [Gossypium stocksii]|uniref:Uncharacterized protein n=1 Tax=Gossypium stocksii TaxID=47602 RepID=A0A9D3UCV8_9ROSI|nr:hypothetical protein J1N35_040008 [Gossypium stocksii]